MNIIRKLTLRHLKENKGRTVVTTMGICVSAAMITAVFIALASFLNLFGELELISKGNYHFSTWANQAQITMLKNDDRIAETGICYQPECGAFQFEKRKSNAAGTGDFICGDKVYIKQIITGTYEGTLPESIGEIAVPKKLIEKNSLDWQVGDTVTIPTGMRYCIAEDADGKYEYDTSGHYKSDEKFRLGENTAYKITAVLGDNPATAGRGNLIYLCAVDENTTLPSDQAMLVTACLKKVDRKSLDTIGNIANEYNISEYKANNGFFEAHFAYSSGDEFMTMLIVPMVIILLVIIITASVVLIYNAFAMSMNERVRYLGMLASVGATKKQKRLSVYFESLILGMIGIPVGMVAGIIGISITLKAIGGKIISTGMISGITPENVTMKTVIPVWAIVGIVLISVLTIIISSFIPSRKASKITPIDAIRQSNEIKVKPKKLRSSRLIRKIFGYEGELANKNLKRNGRKAKVITASIAMSVILFLSCNYFCSLFTSAANIEDQMPYQVSCYTESYDKLVKILDDMSDVDDYYLINNISTHVPKDMTDLFDISNQENLTSAYKSLFSKDVALYLNIIDDYMFNDLCKANNIDAKSFYGDDFKTLLLNNVNRKTGGSRVFTEKVIGTEAESIFHIGNVGLNVGALVDYDPDTIACKLNPSGVISMYMPISQYLKALDTEEPVLGDDGIYYISNFQYDVGIVTDKHAEVCEALTETLLDDGIYYYCSDYVEMTQTTNAVGFVVQVFVYGFIALISLITVFNIINTISTGVHMRKKEFAMLKSVGTTPKGFNKMIMLESAFYGIKAIIFALPISVGISFIIHSYGGSNTIPFEIDYMLYIAVTAVVFAIIGLTMLYSVKKLKNDNIVETLKEEIN